MAGKFDIRPLIEARNGKPTQDKAVRVLAMYAVIPAAIVGLLVSVQLVGWDAPAARLTWACVGGAFGSGFAALLLTLAVHRFFGFRPIIFLADGLIGAFSGFFVGNFMSYAVDSWWPFLLCPAGAVLVPLVAPRPDADADS